MNTMNTIRSLIAPMYWLAARAYWGAMVKNGCPDRAVLQNYLRACCACNDLRGR